MNVTIITDASFDAPTKAGGFGFWIASSRGKLGGGGPLKGEVRDASVAEAMAVVNTMRIGICKDLIARGDSLLIQTDCVPAIMLFKREREARKGQEEEVLVVFDEIVCKYNLAIQLRHVKGHTMRDDARHITNRLCDKRAKEAMRRIRSERIAQPYIERINEVLGL